MAPKKGGRGGKRSKKNEAALQEQTEAQDKTLAEDPKPEEQPENGQEDAAGETNGNEAGGDATKQPGDGGKAATEDDAKQPGTDAKEATADDATKADEPDAKRQATDAAKAELAADAPIGGGPKPSNVIEEGRIYFIYRPKVNQDNPKSVDDVQRFFMILCPTSRKDGKSRIVAIGKKHLPSVPKRERLFGFVYSVADDAEELMKGLGVERYETKTLGTREQPAARIAGEGVYALTGKEKDIGETQLAYKLELPEEPGQVQKDLEIEKEASYHISIKNPETGSPANAGLQEKAEFANDAEKMKQFGNYRWIGAHDPSLLDYPRCELLLIGGRGQVDDETKKHLDQAEHDEVVKALHAAKKEDQEGDAEAEEAALLAKMRAELHPEKEGVPTEPAAEGEWK
jgi:hypothetical protein